MKTLNQHILFLKHLSFFFLLGFFTNNSHGQNTQHEISVIALGGGFSTMSYDLDQGKVNKRLGASFGFRYAYYLNNQWSLGLGVDYQSYNASASLGNVKAAYTTTDFENEDFEFRYTAENYKEEQWLKYLNLPITAQYETLGENTRFYISAGTKLGFPLKGKYQTSANAITTSGYYSQYDAELFDPAFAGFGTYGTQETNKEELDIKLSYSAIIETGIKQKIAEHSSIYVGVYFDYGINSIIDSQDQTRQLVEYDAEDPVNFKYNSVFDSGIAKNMRLISYGIKLRYASKM
ncbi:hypothetical protein JoomaDRAFT_3514 [Galbibacter orientalis DSM 19592]|uniref:Outer membrane protein beta-barrel domain-containing protein n=1 Tax=Galbibacter orientalis DSM 19592 TaxID=926559 RepID=I3CA11_9FLAO|nr:outer membrane beta-barrel protein [Galbibacter orientalis]EIJ40454.1 hypothetical protein JoomaDRAFT_3514 [Galbibacter orientalis DSM 19592]